MQALGNKWSSALVSVEACDDLNHNGRCSDQPRQEMLAVAAMQFRATDIPKVFTLDIRNIRWLDMHTNPGMCEAQYSPLVLDTTGEGIQFKGPQNGVMFDLDASGTPIPSGWIAGHGNGFLVRDLNGNGIIDDGSELFGTATTLKNGERAPNGFEALKELDDNGDGLIDARDSGYDTLKVWVDRNFNAVTDPGELYTLRQLQIDSINLHYLTCTAGGAALPDGSVAGCQIETDRYGNTTKLRSTFRREMRGRSVPLLIIDVWFQTLGQLP